MQPVAPGRLITLPCGGHRTRGIPGSGHGAPGAGPGPAPAAHPAPRIPARGGPGTRRGRTRTHRSRGAPGLPVSGRPPAGRPAAPRPDPMPPAAGSGTPAPARRRPPSNALPHTSSGADAPRPPGPPARRPSRSYGVPRNADHGTHGGGGRGGRGRKQTPSLQVRGGQDPGPAGDGRDGSRTNAAPAVGRKRAGGAVGANGTATEKTPPCAGDWEPAVILHDPGKGAPAETTGAGTGKADGQKVAPTNKRRPSSSADQTRNRRCRHGRQREQTVQPPAGLIRSRRVAAMAANTETPRARPTYGSSTGRDSCNRRQLRYFTCALVRTKVAG